MSEVFTCDCGRRWALDLDVARLARALAQMAGSDGNVDPGDYMAGIPTPLAFAEEIARNYAEADADPA